LIGEKNGSKSHLVTDANGIPLGITITSGSVHDSREIGNLLKARKQTNTKYEKLIADKGYRGQFCAQEARKNHMLLEITDKNRNSIERTHDNFKRFRKLTIRYEKKTNNYLGLFELAAAVIVFRKVMVI
jgi:putative transposase